MTAERGSSGLSRKREEINDHPPKKFGDRIRLIAIEMEGAFGNEGALPLSCSIYAGILRNLVAPSAVLKFAAWLVLAEVAGTYMRNG